MSVPFNDLKREYQTIKDDIDNAIKDVVDNTAFIKGKFLKQFEDDFASYNNIANAVGASSGTSALHLALEGFGIGHGDEVIVPTHTFIGTSEPVKHCGATLKFVDVDPVYYNMDPQKLEEAITPKTKAVIIVHLYGQMTNLEEICSIAKKHNLVVIEDSAQAIGAEYKGNKTGYLGDAACFSFYPGKNLGAYGDAGAVITKHEDAAKKMRMLSDHGRLTKYTHETEGYNYRMDGIQAAILSVKLKHIDSWNDARRKVADFYKENLSGLDIILPEESPDSKSVYHIYCIQVNDRDGFMSKMKGNDVPTGIHYPVPLHLQPAYEHMNIGKGSFPVTEAITEKIVSLPIFPFIAKSEMEQVVEAVKKSV